MVPFLLCVGGALSNYTASDINSLFSLSLSFLHSLLEHVICCNMNTTELSGLIRNEVDLLDYPQYSKDGECLHSSAINHVIPSC